MIILKLFSWCYGRSPSICIAQQGQRNHCVRSAADALMLKQVQLRPNQLGCK